MSLRKSVSRVVLDRPPSWLATNALDLPFRSDAPGRAIGRYGDGSPLTDTGAREILRALLAEEAIARPRPFYTRLPFSLPGVLPRGVRRVLKRLQAGTRIARDDYPRWPCEPAAEALRSVAPIEEFPALHVPPGKTWILALSHDVDTRRGLDVAEEFLAVERERGVRSTLFLVARDYEPADYAARWHEEGFEIGIHGWTHDNRWAYLDAATRRDRLARALRRMEPYAPVGVRIPSLLVSDDLDRTLAEESRVLYDSSRMDTGILSPYRHAVGSGAVRPFRRNGLLEIPISLPLDSALLHLGHSSENMIALWIEKCRWIAAVGGVAVLVNHPEPHLSGNPRGVDRHREFLERVRELNPHVMTLEGIAKMINVP